MPDSTFLSKVARFFPINKHSIVLTAQCLYLQLFVYIFMILLSLLTSIILTAGTLSYLPLLGSARNSDLLIGSQ